MSWLRCDSCDALIDTDEEPGAYNEQRDVWLCANCRGPEPIKDPGEEEEHERKMTDVQTRALAYRFASKKWN